MTIKQTIKDAALMMAQDICVISRGELIANLQSHMSVREQGKFFVETREAIAEMIADGTLKTTVAKRASGQVQHLLMLPDVVLA
jgi:hypothetical protein